MLATITFSPELMNRKIALRKGGDMTRYMTIATTAVQNTAALIQRLLGFSRKQSLARQAIEFTEPITYMEDVLRRSTGKASSSSFRCSRDFPTSIRIVTSLKAPCLTSPSTPGTLAMPTDTPVDVDACSTHV